ncbi:MAG: hypothetical protein R3268_06700 [Acidiferrobacterales bacterium]|nr:hypothetical protein [Acidiferrobacterales bacterium]
MREIEWLFLAILLVATGFLGVVVHVLYRIHADIERIARLRLLDHDRLDEVESALRHIDSQLRGQESSRNQEPRLDAESGAVSSDAWHEALNALEALEEDGAQAKIENIFADEALLEQQPQPSSAKLGRRKRTRG